MNPQDLLRIAEGLARGAIGGGIGRPRQSELRRAVSAAYYALFHTLALSGANTLVGAARANRNRPDWIQVYRALEHGYARNQCNNRTVMGRFSPAIQNFGTFFVLMQQKRQVADYDPSAIFSRSQVLRLVEDSAQTIDRFDDAGARERRAFAIFVLFRVRGN